jgi:hypothetical protein
VPAEAREVLGDELAEAINQQGGEEIMPKITGSTGPLGDELAPWLSPAHQGALQRARNVPMPLLGLHRTNVEDLLVRGVPVRVHARHRPHEAARCPSEGDHRRALSWLDAVIHRSHTGLTFTMPTN